MPIFIGLIARCDLVPSGTPVSSAMPPSIYHSSSPTHPTSVPRPHSPPPYLDPSDSGSRQPSHDQVRGTPSLRAESSFEESEGYGNLQLLPNNPLQQYRRDVVGQSLPESGVHAFSANTFPEQQKKEHRRFASFTSFLYDAFGVRLFWETYL